MKAYPSKISHTTNTSYISFLQLCSPAEDSYGCPSHYVPFCTLSCTCTYPSLAVLDRLMPCHSAARRICSQVQAQRYVGRQRVARLRNRQRLVANDRTETINCIFPTNVLQPWRGKGQGSTGVQRETCRCPTGNQYATSFARDVNFHPSQPHMQTPTHA